MSTVVHVAKWVPLDMVLSHWIDINIFDMGIEGQIVILIWSQLLNDQILYLITMFLGVKIEP